MLYKFKSQATSDVIMLQSTAEELLTLIGKLPGPTGIVTVAQAAPAIAALRAEIQRREAQGPSPMPESTDQTEDAAQDEVVSLRRRAAPFIELLERASAAGKDVVWGV